jgi:hypothetical protein
MSPSRATQTLCSMHLTSLPLPSSLRRTCASVQPTGHPFILHLHQVRPHRLHRTVIRVDYIVPFSALITAHLHLRRLCYVLVCVDCGLPRPGACHRALSTAWGLRLKNMRLFALGGFDKGLWQSTANNSNFEGKPKCKHFDSPSGATEGRR